MIERKASDTQFDARLITPDKKSEQSSSEEFEEDQINSKAVVKQENESAVELSSLGSNHIGKKRILIVDDQSYNIEAA